MIRPIYVRLGQLMIEFMHWIDERAGENKEYRQQRQLTVCG